MATSGLSRLAGELRERKLVNFMNSIRTQHINRTVVVATALVLVWSVASRAQERPDFTGHWNLNHQQSNNVTQLLPFNGDLIRSSRFDQQASSETVFTRTLGGLQGDSAPPSSIFVRLTDQELRITTQKDCTITLYTDGRIQQMTLGKNNIRVMTRWVNQDLVTVRDSDEGETMRTSYTMARGGYQMFVTTTIWRRETKKPIVIHLVYDYDS